MIEKFVQFLVGIIYTKLLERICREIFKAKNIENPQESFTIVSWICAAVDFVYQPSKSLGV